ncbi:MAG: hypothetical protein ACLTMP_04215 [Eggerthella lenta]
MHTDAVQAFAAPRRGMSWMPTCCRSARGTSGVGALYVRRGTWSFTTAFGGGHGRSGTEALPYRRLAEAARIAHASKRQIRARASPAHVVGALRHRYADVIVISRDGGSFIVNFAAGHRQSSGVADLSDAGVFLSASMACSSTTPQCLRHLAREASAGIAAGGRAPGPRGAPIASASVTEPRLPRSIGS